MDCQRRDGERGMAFADAVDVDEKDQKAGLFHRGVFDNTAEVLGDGDTGGSA